MNTLQSRCRPYCWPAWDARQILIIEDDPHIADGLQLNLSLKGYQVSIAPDGPSGLQQLFVTNPGKRLSRSKSLEIGWRCTGRVNSRTVDNFVVRMRKYFEEDPKNPVHFKSLRSVGYVFEPGQRPAD